MSGTGLPFLENLPLQYATPLFAAFFITAWSGALFLAAVFSGWAELARQYRLNKRYEGRKWYFCSAHFGPSFFGVSYGGILTAGATGDGLYLAVILPFRPGHPPLFIPWDHVRRPARRWHEFFGTPLELGVNGTAVRALFYWGLVDTLEAESGRRIPVA